MKYRELIIACQRNYENQIKTVLIKADTLEAEKELSKNNPETEDGYTPVTSGAGFSLFSRVRDGALGDMEVISVGIKDEKTLVVHL